MYTKIEEFAPDDPTLSQLPFFPEKPRNWPDPGRRTPVLFELAKIQHLLQVSYEFRKTLFNILPLTDLSNAVRALEINLTEKEKAMFLHPLRGFSDDFDIFKKLVDRSWGITAFGSDEDIRCILNDLLTTENDWFRSQDSSRGGCCRLLFSQPDQACLPSDKSEIS